MSYGKHGPMARRAAILAALPLLLGGSGALAQSMPSQATTEETETGDEEGDGLPITGSLQAETSVGIGSFVQGPQRQTYVTTAFAPSIAYDLGGGMKLQAGTAGTWYQKTDYGTNLAEGKFLWSDVSLAFAHGAIWRDDELGMRLGGSLTVLLPTSLASQFQNRALSLRPGLNWSWRIGRGFSMGATFSFQKMFSTSTQPAVDCGDFSNPEQCRQGRNGGAGPGGGFEPERRGGEIFIPATGVNSFMTAYGLKLGWNFAEDWTLRGQARVFQIFGVTAPPGDDELASENAHGGRSQIDRFRASVTLAWSVMEHLGIATSLRTDTIRPLGDRGNELLPADRASDNITTLNIALTGKL